MTAGDEKRRLRGRLLQARSALPPGERSAAALAIADRLAALPEWRRARTVALYAPLGAEVDTAELVRRAAAAGKRVAWPRLVPGRREMDFAPCPPGDLVEGARGTREPPRSVPALGAADLDLILVPGVAFDALGCRLGRGAGHYDATLAAMVVPGPMGGPGPVFPRAFGLATVGLAFDAQIVPRVPSEPHDVRLAAVVTELRTIVAPGAG